VPQNKQDGFELKDPTTDQERADVARDFAKQFKLKLPILMDTMDDKMEKAYCGWPDRLYVIDAQGKLAYVGKPGPRGFKPDELPAVLEGLLKK
jgi:hypothetical protein